jgi:hypothetical protein
VIERWVGIDCGYSQMTIAILDDRINLIASERTCEPTGDGHNREVAIARLKVLLRDLSDFSSVPVKLSGYCYEDSGIIETFREAGWIVNDCKALNDVVGFYGLTDMSGNIITCGCGSFSQVVYADIENNICWPGEDVDAELPNWMLSGWDYASFLLELSKRENSCELVWLQKAVQDTLGGDALKTSGHRWSYLGPMVEGLLGTNELGQFLAHAADSVIQTKNVFMEHLKGYESPRIIFGGGAVRSEALWAALKSEFVKRGESVMRVEGEPAVGLARFAAYNADANPWAYIGLKRPSWL